jgi:hypothetical protein
LEPIRFAKIVCRRAVFIGGIHRTSVAITGKWTLVVVARSVAWAKAKTSVAAVGHAADRSDGCWPHRSERQRLSAEPDQRHFGTFASTRAPGASLLYTSMTLTIAEGSGGAPGVIATAGSE